MGCTTEIDLENDLHLTPVNCGRKREYVSFVETLGSSERERERERERANFQETFGGPAGFRRILEMATDSIFA